MGGCSNRIPVCEAVAIPLIHRYIAGALVTVDIVIALLVLVWTGWGLDVQLYMLLELFNRNVRKADGTQLNLLNIVLHHHLTSCNSIRVQKMHTWTSLGVPKQIMW